MAIAACVISCSLALAVEPHAFVDLRVERVSADSGPRLLRLSLTPSVDLADARLTVTAPDDVVVRSPDGPLEAAPRLDGRTAASLAAGDLRRGRTRTREFEIALPPDRTGVIEFVVEGTRADGTRIRESVGVALRNGEPAGRVRLGAHEFPAAVLPPGAP